MRNGRFALAAVCALTALIALPILGRAGYVPGPGSPIKAPPGAYPTVAGSFTLNRDNTATSASCGNSAVSVPVTLPSGAHVVVNVPARVLPSGTQVTAWAGSSSVLAPTLPSGQKYLDAFAIGWTAADGSAPQACLPFSVVIAEGAITPSTFLYETTGSGVGPIPPGDNAAAAAGSATFSFAHDPGFVLAQAPAAATTVPAPNGSVPAGPGSTGGGAGMNATPRSLWPAAAALLAGLAVLGALRRHRRTGVTTQPKAE